MQSCTSQPVYSSKRTSQDDTTAAVAIASDSGLGWLARQLQMDSGSGSHTSSDQLQTAGKNNLISGDRRNKYKCPICGKENRDNSDLRRHFMIHTGEKPYQCPNCQYRTAQRRTLQHHMMRAHAFVLPE